MESVHKVALVIVAAAIVGGLSLTLLLMTEKPKIGEFLEFSQMHFYIDPSGDARGEYVTRLPPSELSEFVKFLIRGVGSDQIEQLLIETIRGELAKQGLEARNFNHFEITGLAPAEDLTITLTWEMPNVARWENDRWTISSGWIDNLGGAKETIAQLESVWMQIRVIAQLHGMDVAFYRQSVIGALVLPENASDIYLPLLPQQTIDFGGGSYSKSSLYVDTIDGRPAIIENYLFVLASRNRITITPEQFLENYAFYAISYRGISPENVSFADSLERVRLDLKYGREMDSWWIFSENSWFPLSPPQTLYYAADAIVNLAENRRFSILAPTKTVSAPIEERGDWQISWKTLSRDEYVALAREVRARIEASSRAPGSLGTPVGEMRFRDILYTFVRVLSGYGKAGGLPDSLILAPSPSGQLGWGDIVLPANHAYFLLPDTYVITHTARVNTVLGNIRELGFDNRGLAEEICDWVGSNITYALSLRIPTSEDVLQSRRGQCREYTNVYLALARTAGIPARRVSGWVISIWTPPAGWEFAFGRTPEGETVASHAWVQVWLPDEGWVPVEPQSRRPDLYVGRTPYEVDRELEQTWARALAGYETAYRVI